MITTRAPDGANKVMIVAKRILANKFCQLNSSFQSYIILQMEFSLPDSEFPKYDLFAQIMTKDRGLRLILGQSLMKRKVPQKHKRSKKSLTK